MPLLIATALIVAIAVWTGVATFRDHGEVERWAAISTMWIVIPIMIAGLIFLLLFAGMIYGMARLLQLIPPYTSQAQNFIWRIQAYIKRGTEAVVSPVFSLEGLLAMIRRIFGA